MPSTKVAVLERAHSDTSPTIFRNLHQFEDQRADLLGQNNEFPPVVLDALLPDFCSGWTLLIYSMGEADLHG